TEHSNRGRETFRSMDPITRMLEAEATSQRNEAMNPVNINKSIQSRTIPPQTGMTLVLSVGPDLHSRLRVATGGRTAAVFGKVKAELRDDAIVAGTNSVGSEPAGIDLPDLGGKAADEEIHSDNIRAREALYAAVMLEEMKIYQSSDKIVAIFQ